jgi:hypothetical protein
MASAELSRRVEKVVAYPPLCDMGAAQRREFHEALLDADSFAKSPREVAGSDPQARAESACLRLELEGLAAVVAGCHGPIPPSTRAFDASGEVGAVCEAGSSAASTCQHDADALILGRHLA